MDEATQQIKDILEAALRAAERTFDSQGYVSDDSGHALEALDQDIRSIWRFYSLGEHGELDTGNDPCHKCGQEMETTIHTTTTCGNLDCPEAWLYHEDWKKHMRVSWAEESDPPTGQTPPPYEEFAQAYADLDDPFAPTPRQS